MRVYQFVFLTSTVLFTRKYSILHAHVTYFVMYMKIKCIAIESYALQLKVMQ